MRVTKSRIRQLINEAVQNILKEEAVLANLDEIGDDLVVALRSAGFSKAKKGRGYVEDYGYGQNRDVFVYGPFRADLLKHLKNGQVLGKYFLGIYTRPDDKDVFEAYVATVNNTKFTENISTGFEFPEGPLTIFEMHKKNAELIKRKDKNAKQYNVASSGILTKYLSKIFFKGTHRLSNLESYWVERANSASPGTGTHANGGAIDLKGYSENTSKSDLMSIKNIIKTVASKHGTRLKSFGVEADHIHLSFKV